jgi:lia operon protein LiaF
MEKRNDHRNRNIAIFLILAGLFLLVHNHMSFFTVIAIVLLLIGVKKIRSGSTRKGYVFLGIGTIIIIGGQISLVIAIVLMSLGFFYIKSKQLHRDDSYVQKQSLIESIRWGKDPWIVRNYAIWNIIGELVIDLTLAIHDQKETTLILQGVIADVDIVVPEGVGVSVQASVLLGQINAGPEKESGIANKIVWQSPDYEYCEQQVKIIIFYVIGDIDIKIV